MNVYITISSFFKKGIIVDLILVIGLIIEVISRSKPVMPLPIIKVTMQRKKRGKQECK